VNAVEIAVVLYQLTALNKAALLQLTFGFLLQLLLFDLHLSVLDALYFFDGYLYFLVFLHF
jgi:hypothetical protein